MPETPTDTPKPAAKEAKVEATDQAKPATPATPAKPAGKNNTNKTVIIIVVVVVVLFVILPVLFFTVGAVMFGNELSKQTGVNVDSNSKSVTVKDKDGNEFSAGEDKTLPKDFPTGIPIYDGDIEGSGKITTEGKTAWTVTMTTSDSVSKVSESQTASFSTDGWTTSMNSDTSDGGLIIAKKGTLNVNTYYNSKDGKTAIVYTVSESAE
ncbi:MAG: hypothetical protein QG553_491 [Patescibacteria group bacterium]|nr:hypothetical protein [Patescibacteria group bacterium]